MCQKLILTSLTVFLITLTSILTPAFAISWSEYEVRLTSYQDFDGIPSIMLTSDGNMWAVWVRCVKLDYNLYCKISSDDGASWSSETTLTTDPRIDTSPSIYQDNNGTIWLVWSSSRAGGYDLYYKTSSDSGLSWSNATRLTTSPADDLSASIVETLNGTVWVVWSSSRTGGYDLYYKTSSDSGLSWSNATRLTTDPDLDKLPSITQTDDGKIWVAWSSDRTGDPEIFYKTYNGSAWSNETQLTTDQKIDSDPSLIQTADHRIWMFWTSRGQQPSATDDIYYKYSLDYGATWSETIQFTTDAYDDLWVCAQAGDLAIWVIWTSNRADQPDGNWDIYYRTSLVGDVNEDGRVDIYDLAMVSSLYATAKGDPRFDPDLDLNGDGFIDIRDLSIVGRNYGGK